MIMDLMPTKKIVQGSGVCRRGVPRVRQMLAEAGPDGRPWKDPGKTPYLSL